MTTFGLITEGITDQEVITNILFGYYDNPDLDITELQPLKDETDSKKSANFGGWGNLLEYCKSKKFREAFQAISYIIIQIDTDICEEYGVPKNEAGKTLSPEELVSKVTEKFIAQIGIDFYEKVAERIIFAVSVHSIECWLLPIYFPNDKAKKGKTVNCLDTLNLALSKKESFTIDKSHKNFDYYAKISTIFSKNKELKKYYPHNPSFAIFIQKLDDLQIQIS